MRLEDLHPTTLFQIVAAGFRVEKKPFFKIRIQIPPELPIFLSIETATVEITPLHIFVDYAFVNDTLYIFAQHFRFSNSFETETNYFQPRNPIISKTILQEVLNLSWTNHSLRTTLCSTQMESLKHIPDFPNSPLALPPLNLSEFETTRSFISNIFTNSYSSSTKCQMLSVFFRLPAFFNIARVSSNFIRHMSRLVHGEIVE